ncbi:carbohydrate porin [Pseudovibrio sp. WM33]|uniref:carbohydrate porin n=1 Tax=Pseudovibrio sp. WM33 TaxID=1735585 RepID=UPI0007B2DF2C|nr:carbohydrate porin [Pseudovibrio sp. WM33]KZL25321.1 Porin B precursor [Pseudovibrio sp. WM33]
MKFASAQKVFVCVVSCCWMLLACHCFPTNFLRIAKAETGHWPLGWEKWDKATGDWGGVRTNLKQEGVEFFSNLVSDFLANPVGGLSQGRAYSGAFISSIELNLERIVGWKGAKFGFGFSQGLGQDLSAETIGNKFDVNQAFIGKIFGLSQLKFSQTLWDEAVDIEFGRLTVGKSFAGTEAFHYYVNNGANGTPSQIGVNIHSFTTDPFNQWGLYGRYLMSPFLYVSGGLYNASADALINADRGFNFRFNPEDGILYIGQGGLFVGKDKIGWGLPGRYHLGGYYDSSDYTLLADPALKKAGNWGLYAIADQMVYRESGDQGLMVWGVVTFAPEQRVNTFPWGGNAGLYYRGLFPDRDEDVTALGVIWGLFSEDLAGQSYEMVVEVNHRFQLAPWAYWTADLQYVINPDGRRKISNAVVAGFELSIDF